MTTDEEVRDLVDEVERLGAKLAKAYEHAALQAGVTSFASKKAWLRQMELTREGRTNDAR